MYLNAGLLGIDSRCPTVDCKRLQQRPSKRYPNKAFTKITIALYIIRACATDGGAITHRRNPYNMSLNLPSYIYLTPKPEALAAALAAPAASDLATWRRWRCSPGMWGFEKPDLRIKIGMQ